LCSSCHKRYDYTDERRKKLSKAFKGRKITWGYKISKANTGRKLSEKTKKKIGEYNKAHPRPIDKNGRFCKK
jgi:hypothetical protein